MTAPEETEVAVRQLMKENRRRGIFSLIAAAIIGMLTLGLWSVSQDLDAVREGSQERSERLGTMEAALDLQREQFEACVGEKPSTQGCKLPIAPPAESIPGPEGDEDSQGLQGIQGPIGPVGPTGKGGATGPRGPRGLQGEPGATGATGDTGPPGPAGPPGPQGVQGEPGPAGQNGSDGANGQDAPVIQRMAFRVDANNNCVLIVTFDRGDPIRTEVPNDFCPELTPNPTD